MRRWARLADLVHWFGRFRTERRGLKRLKPFGGLFHGRAIGLEALGILQGFGGRVQIVPVHLGVGHADPRVDARRIGPRRAPERGKRVGCPVEVGEHHALPHQRARVARVALNGRRRTPRSRRVNRRRATG